MEEETAEDRAGAVRRELLFYLRMADAADRVLAPERRHVPIDREDPSLEPFSFADPAEALAWCDGELHSLLPAVDQAVELGYDDLAWKLPVALIYFLRLRKHHNYRYELSTVAVRATRSLRDKWGEAWGLICLGGAESDLERHEDALGHFAEALRISREIHDRQWEANSLYNLGWTLRLMGRSDEALEHQRQAAVLQRASHDRRSESITLTELAALALDFGRTTQAYEEYGQALAGARATADLHTEAKSLHGLGDVCRTTGEVGEAIDHYQQAVDVRRRVGDLLGLACSLFEGGKLLDAVGRTDAAQRALAEAVVLFDNLQDATADEVRNHLAEHHGDARDGS